MHAHHIFSQEYEKQFIERGINIHHYKNVVWWEEHGHLKFAKEYNQKWCDFFETHPDATKAQVLEYGKKLMKKYGIPTNLGEK